MEKSKNCYKCKEKASFYFKQQNYICKNCFIPLISRKFGTFLRQKLKMTGKQLTNLCFFDGSPNSVAMADLFNTRYEL